MVAALARSLIMLTASYLLSELGLLSLLRNTSGWRRVFGKAILHTAAVLVFTGTLAAWPIAVAVLSTTLVMELLLGRRQKRQSIVVIKWAGYGLLICIFSLSLAESGIYQTSLWLLLPPVVFSALLVMIGFCLSVFASSSLVGEIVRPYLEQIRSGKVYLEGDQLDDWRGLYGGGETIGKMERALIFLLIFVGEPAGVGFLIAAKSILRFGDLNARQDRMEAEYIIIGTFASFFFGYLIAFLTTNLLDVI